MNIARVKNVLTSLVFGTWAVVRGVRKDMRHYKDFTAMIKQINKCSAQAKRVGLSYGEMARAVATLKGRPVTFNDYLEIKQMLKGITAR